MKDNKVGIIYCLISPSNRVYIGQSWNLKQRLYHYRSNKSCKCQIKLWRALNKYGFDNFELEILDYCFTQDQLDDSECYWINFYNSIKNGYNCRGGGRNGGWTKHMKKIISEKTKEGMKQSPRSKESYVLAGLKMRGKIVSVETRTLISQNRKGKGCGERNAWKGKHLPLEVREKISRSNKGKIRTKETREKISKVSKSIAYWKHNKMTDEMIKNKSKSAQMYEYTIVDPFGNVYLTRSLRMFCKEHGLGDSSRFSYASRGLTENNMYKGWKITRVPIPAIVESQQHE